MVSSKNGWGLLPVVTIACLIPLFGIVAAARGGWLDKGTDMLKSLGGRAGKTGLSSTDLASAFKEALHIGTENVVARLGRPDGFNTDQAIHIPLPEQMETVRSALAKVGLSQSLDDLELKLNRAAENATPKAKALPKPYKSHLGTKKGQWAGNWQKRQISNIRAAGWNF